VHTQPVVRIPDFAQARPRSAGGSSWTSGWCRSRRTGDIDSALTPVKTVRVGSSWRATLVNSCARWPSRTASCRSGSASRRPMPRDCVPPCQAMTTRPPARVTRCSSRSPAVRSGHNATLFTETTQSNAADGKPVCSAVPTRRSTLPPFTCLRWRRTARSHICGEGSTPQTCAAPVRVSMRMSPPGPYPTSRTRSPTRTSSSSPRPRCRFVQSISHPVSRPHRPRGKAKHDRTGSSHAQADIDFIASGWRFKAT
jgi:hypothetical protein